MPSTISQQGMQMHCRRRIGGLFEHVDEPLSNQSVKFAVQVCSPDLLFNSLENLS